MRGDRAADPATVTRRVHAAYAALLLWSGWLSLAALVAAFAVYVLGLLPPLLPVEQLPHLWTLSAPELHQRAAHPAGWSWLALLDRGDVLNLLGIALLSGCSAVPLVAVTWIFARAGDRTYALLAAAQVAVLVVAASGLIASGH